MAKKILIIDDDPNIVTYLEDIFQLSYPQSLEEVSSHCLDLPLASHAQIVCQMMVANDQLHIRLQARNENYQELTFHRR